MRARYFCCLGVFLGLLLAGMKAKRRWRLMLWLGLWMAIAGALVSAAVGSVVLAVQARAWRGCCGILANWRWLRCSEPCLPE